METTIKCSIFSGLFLANLMRRHLDSLFEHAKKSMMQSFRPESVEHFQAQSWRVVREMINWFNYLDLDIHQDMLKTIPMTIPCDPRDVAALGVFLDCNIENIWIALKYDGLKMTPKGNALLKEQLPALIREMRDCLGVKMDWRTAN